MAINGQIVDEINGLIASRDSIRSTMKAAGIASDTSKLADLATNLNRAKQPSRYYAVYGSDHTIPKGKLLTGDQVIMGVTTSGIEAANIKSGTTIKVGDGMEPGSIKNVTGTFTKEDNNPITAAAILSGKVGYVNGNKVTGTMPNATVTSSSATISSVSYTYNSSNGNFGVTGSVAIAAPTVGTAGYISSSAGTRNGGTASLSATVAKIAGSTSISGTTTKAPAISKQSFTISGVADAAAAAAQTSTPTSSTYKAWVKVKSAANTGTLTATPSVSTAGYGTGSYHGIAAASATVGAAASADTYIPIKNGAYSASVSTSAGSASMSATGVSTTTSATNYYITLSTSAGSATGKATIGTAGWINTGSSSSSPASVSVNGNGTKLYLATYAPSTITVTNSSQTLSTSGKVCTGNITIPAVNYYYTSTSAPSSTSGYNNGDVWLVTA